MKVGKYIALISLVCLTLKTFATHIVGGEIYYDCLGTNKYYVTLKLYLDCCPTCTSFDNIAPIGVFDAQGKVVKALQFPLLNVSKVPPSLYAKCFNIPSDFCVNEIIYGDTVVLAPIPGGYSIAYQRCCRNADIINITDASSIGSTYQTFIDPSVPEGNGSSRYKNLPPLLLCVSVPFKFDHSVKDPDNDSIYYELCSPFDGADPFFPMPDTPSNPPYNFVQYNAPYSGSYPIQSSPSFTIDPHTGYLTGTPTMIGRFVVGVCAKEYRKGVLLNINKRDYQFNITHCPKSVMASIKNQTSFCSGLKMDFSQNSVGALSYHWDFGEPTTVLDTANVSSPVWTYSDTGTYNIRLIINQYTLCADTAYATVKIQALLNPYFVPPAPKCMNEPNEGFTVMGNYTTNATYQWNFGPTAFPSSVQLKDPGKIRYNAGGTYPVTLIVSDHGCSKIFTDSIHVFEKPEAAYHTESPVSCVLQPVHFIDKSSGTQPLDYLWSFGDEHSSTLKSPYHTYNKEGTYYTRLVIATKNGCKDTFALPTELTVHQVPTADFDINPKDTSVFYSTISLQDFSKNTKNCSMVWGDGINGDCYTGHVYTVPGTYQVMQIAENEGCFDTAFAHVIVRPEFVFWLPNAFTPGTADGLNDVFKPRVIGVHHYRLLIFDRWGQQLFETFDPDEGWNGYINNRLCQQDIYVYKITFKDDVRLKSHQYIGHFTLIH